MSTPFHLYQGEPTDEEINERRKSGNHQQNFHHRCPNCTSRNTEYLRNTYWMCHACGIWFHTQDALGVYDQVAYDQDTRLSQEDLLLLEEGT